MPSHGYLRPLRRFPRIPRLLPLFLVVVLLQAVVLPALPLAGGAAYAQDTPEVEHPRREMAERAFHTLKEALSPDYPTVREATLHFVDLPIANAWVNQKAEVYVATGLLDLLQTEDQIAGVLAHELAHVTEQHVPKQIRRAINWTLLAIALSFVGDRSDFDRQQRANLAVLHPLVLYAYSREAELEADQVAVQHLRRTHYDPGGLLKSLELLAAQSSRAPVEELWMTHPLPEIRLGEMRRQLDPWMGIPLPKPVGWNGRPRSHFEEPVEAALAFLQAAWTDPDRLAERLGDPAALPAPLQPGASPGLLPAQWPAGFPVSLLGGYVEREGRELVTYVVDGHLELESPLGTLRTAPLRITVQPKAEGWQVYRVVLLDGQSAPSTAPAGGPGAGLPPQLRTLLDRLGGTIASGGATGTLVGYPADGAFAPMAQGANTLLASGFSLRPLPVQVRPLEGPVFGQLAPPADMVAVEPAGYADVVLAWELQGPAGETLVAQRRLWLAYGGEGDGLRILRAFPVPLHLDMTDGGAGGGDRAP